MKTLRNILLAVAALIAPLTPAFAQYSSSVLNQNPTYSGSVQTFTGVANGNANRLVGYSSGVIEVTGTGLTTVTWAIQGSIDGGVTWQALPVAAFPTTALPSTLAASETTTATGTFYLVNVAGFTNYRFVTSGTFTATSVGFKLTASQYKGLL